MGKNISANQLMVLKLFLLKERFHNQTEFISVFFLQLTMKKSRQSDVVERLKPPVPERPKLVSRNLQTKDVLDENLKEENRERNNEESGKDGGYHSSETKEIKIDLDDVERGILINDAPRSEMEPLCSNLEDEDDKEEEESDDVNTSFLQNEGRKGPVASVMVLPSISIAHFSKEKELTLAEPLRNVEEKITIEKEEGSCEGKEDDEEGISGKEVLCYAWQIAKGMVRTFSTKECLKQFSHRLRITKICLFPVSCLKYCMTSFSVSTSIYYLVIRRQIFRAFKLLR